MTYCNQGAKGWPLSFLRFNELYLTAGGKLVEGYLRGKKPSLSGNQTIYVGFKASEACLLSKDYV